MGCWNGTCAISNLPINYEDPIRAFVLLESRPYDEDEVGGGFCYPTGIWSALGPPLRGRYNDYGGIENVVEGLNAEILKDRFFADVIPHETLGANSDWNTMLGAIADGTVKVRNGGNWKVCRVGQALVHEDIFQAMLALNWRATGIRVNGSIVRQQGRIYLARLPGLIEQLDAVRTLRSTPMLRSSIAEGFFETALFHTLETDLGYLHGYDTFICEKIATGTPTTDPALVQLVDDLADYMVVRSLMSLGRRFWSPQSGAGSQNDATDVHVLLADAVKAHVAAREIRCAAV